MTHGAFVIGEPAPQGSKRHVGNGILVESSEKVKPWRDAVSSTFASTSGRRPLEGPLEVKVRWYLRAPVSLSKKKRAMGPYRKPDADKLLRATFDGLSDSGVWKDDAQVVRCVMEKVYAEDGQATGARILVSEAERDEVLHADSQGEEAK